MTIVILNGPNLNLLGTREPGIYGNRSLEQIMAGLAGDFPEVTFIHHQSNLEGELVQWIQYYGVFLKEGASGIIINAGGYSHTSVALADALTLCKIPAVEVHLSNIYSRENYRHTSLTGARCRGVITGFGELSYWLAVNYIKKINSSPFGG